MNSMTMVLGWSAMQWACASQLLGVELIPVKLGRALAIQVVWWERYDHEPLGTEIGRALFQWSESLRVQAVRFVTYIAAGVEP